MSNVNIYKGYKGNFSIDETLSEYVNFKKNDSYILEINNDPIGFFNVIKFSGIDKISLEIALLKKYRGKGLSNDIHKIVFDYVCKKYDNYDEIMILINYKNTPSIKLALKSGYKLYYNCDQDEDEFVNMNKYTIKNPYYKENKKTR